MKKLAITLVVLIAVASSVHAQTAPQISVESVPDFFRLPIGVNFGEVPAVAVNSRVMWGASGVHSRPSESKPSDSRSLAMPG